MQRIVLLFAGIALGVRAQDRPKPLHLNKALTDYSFPIHPGMQAFRFHVEINPTRTITGVTVFRPGAASPFQVLPSCMDNLKMELDEHDAGRELLKHADLNFDGFEDVQLLQYYSPHLGKSVYCIYVWDPNRGQFRYAPEIPATDPVPHPETKTISVHEDWMGGAYADRVYRWLAGKVELIEENSSLSGSEDPTCGFTDFCSKLVNGKMVLTARKPFGCSDRPEEHLECSKVPKRSTIPTKKKSIRKF